MKRFLSDGHVISRTKPPHSNHNVYYVDAGPEGDLLVIDLNLIPMSVILAAIAWEHDNAINTGKPSKEFNKIGFSY